MDEPEPRATPETLQFLRDAFPEEWREEPLGWDGVLEWETAHGVTLPEPYRSFIAEVSNGSALGPPADGGLLPLGWMPLLWPDYTGIGFLDWVRQWHNGEAAFADE